MSIRHLLILCLFLVPTWLDAGHKKRETTTLKTQFATAQAGDYVVAEQNKTYTLMHIHSRMGDSLIVEEISVPHYQLKFPMDWRKWVAAQAPGNTSWVLYQIDLKAGTVVKAYSFTTRGWSKEVGIQQYLPTLLQLTLTSISDSERKRVGVAPLPGDIERRPMWSPPAYYLGEKKAEVVFTAWRAVWPKDQSELSGRTIDLYLAGAESGLPSYFPYWVEVRGVANQAKLRVKDTGRGMVSPKKGFPSQREL